MDQRAPALKPSLLILAYVAFGLVVGLLGADAFALAVGLPEVGTLTKSEQGLAIFLRVVLGVVLVFVSIVFAAVAVRTIGATADRMASSPRRPGLAISIVLVSCGSACIVLALIFYWWLAAASTIVRPALAEGQAVTVEATRGRAGGTVVTSSGPVAIGKVTSPLTHVVAVGTFAVGLGMLAVGIWGSMGGRGAVATEPHVAPAYSHAPPA
jgi:hypothetical protein